MKHLLPVVFSISFCLCSHAQTVLTIKGADNSQPTLYINGGLDLYLNGGLNIDSTGSGTTITNNYLQNNGAIYIATDPIGGQGDFTNNVNGLISYTPGQLTGDVIFVGQQKVQYITGGGSMQFMNLTVNNLLSPKILLGEDVQVNGILNLGGVINVQANDLTLSVTGTLSGSPFSTTNMIQADGTGQFIRQINGGAGNYLFPIGDSTPFYSPVAVNFVSNTDTGSLGVNVKPVAHPQINNPAPAIDYLKRYWTFTNSGLSNYSYTGQFIYHPSDIAGTESLIKLSRWENPWVTDTGSLAASDTLTITSALNQSSAPLSGDFTGRNSICKTAVINAVKQVICQGDSFAGHAISGHYKDTILSALGCDSSILELELSVLPTSIKPTIQKRGDTLIASPSNTYVWYQDSTALPDSSNILIISHSGNYSVVVTDSGSCSSQSDVFSAIYTGINMVEATPLIAVFPNPADDLLNVQISGLASGQDIIIRLYDAFGQLILSQKSIAISIYNTQLHTVDLSSGLYFLNIQQGSWVVSKKILISR